MTSFARSTAAGLALLALSGAASAHERWVRHTLLRPLDHTLFERPTLLNVGTACAIVVGVTWGWKRRTTAPPRPPASDAFVAMCSLLMRIAYGLTLFFMARKSVYLSPDLIIDTSSVGGRALVSASVVVGIFLASGLYLRTFATLSTVLFAFAVAFRPFHKFDGLPITPGNVLMNFEVVGVACYLVFSSYSLRRVPGCDPVQANEAGTGLLRVILGLTLIWLGFCKFSDPDLFAGVVQNYPQIFYDPFAFLGLKESTVVFGACAVEFGLGLAVLLGAFLQLSLVLLTIVLCATAVFFQEEVLGHVILIATVITLFVNGSGRARSVVPFLRSALSPVSQALAKPKIVFRYVQRTIAVAAMAALVWVFVGAPAPATIDAKMTLTASNPLVQVVGSRGRARVSVELQPHRVELNKFFAFTVQVADARSGLPFEGSEIQFDVTMPEHGHGMPTKHVIRWVDLATFRVEGCKLNMFGNWLVQVRVFKDGREIEETTIPLEFDAPTT